MKRSKLPGARTIKAEDGRLRKKKAKYSDEYNEAFIIITKQSQLFKLN